jgi:AcrR family transcriptional regulator
MKEQILLGTCQYLLINGIMGMSLRPLAKSLKTSDRMILYYFGTKDRLITEAVELIAKQLIETIQRNLESKTISNSGEFVEMIWQIFTSEENEKAAHLFFEIDILSFRQPDIYQPMAISLMTGWFELIEKGLRDLGMLPETLKEISTGLASEIMGLSLYHLVCGDQRASENLKYLVNRINFL